MQVIDADFQLNYVWCLTLPEFDLCFRSQGGTVFARDFKSFLIWSTQKTLQLFLVLFAFKHMMIDTEHKLSDIICNLHLLPDSSV